jgi:hypothetical protein
MERLPTFPGWAISPQDHARNFTTVRKQETQMSEVAELLARVVRQCVQEGHRVDIDGLGTFAPDDSREGLHFIAESAPRVFIAYAVEDVQHAEQLYKDLRAAGLNPWLDRRKLLPGQNWKLAIRHAIEKADFFVACFSSTSIRKRGQFPQELRIALRTGDGLPLDDTFIYPVRFDDCEVPARIRSTFQYVDLFSDWTAGVTKLADSMWREFGARLSRY